MVDLHVHSNKSDGTFTPSELVTMAIKKNLTALALTDHDTTDGLEELANAAAGKPLAVVPGIELSTEYEGKDIHIVGLFIDPTQSDFRAHLKAFVESRDDRNRKMCANLQEAGIPISYEALQEANPGSVITRAHYGTWLLEHGVVSSVADAFSKYLGDHTPYFVPREKVTPQQAVSLIQKAGGLAILAHPILYRMSRERLDILVRCLKEVGLTGIEAIYATYNSREENQIRQLASRYDLLLSGGSDFHGFAKPKLELGTGYGHLCVPDEVYFSLKKEHEKM